MTDVNEEMKLLVKKYTRDGEYIAGVISHKIVDHLEATNPRFLQRWAEANAQAALTQFVSSISNGDRATARAQAKRREFSLAADTFEQTGDPTLLSQFDVEYVINSDNVRRKVRDMTATDVAFVARRYESIVNTARLEAAFHRAIEERMIREGAATIADIFTEEEYLHLYSSIVN